MSVRGRIGLRCYRLATPYLRVRSTGFRDARHRSRLVGALNHTGRTSPATFTYDAGVADSLDLDAFTERFRERAKAVRNRPFPPVEGAERARIKERAQQDFLDFALVGDAVATIEDGILTLRVDLRPPTDASPVNASP